MTRWFGGLTRGPAVARRPAPPVTLAADAYATLEDRVQLPRVYNAWHTVKAFAPDDAALNLRADVLASGKSSRLYRRLVYELQIASQVSAYADGSRLDGTFRISTTARPGHDLNELQRVVDEEVRRVAETGPAPREMERVLNQTEAQFLNQMERVGGKADRLAFYDYFVGTPDYFQADLDRYRHVTAADVQRVARDYLLRAHRVVLSVVPQGRQQLAASQPGGN
jgi:zinc protease